MYRNRLGGPAVPGAPNPTPYARVQPSRLHPSEAPGAAKPDTLRPEVVQPSRLHPSEAPGAAKPDAPRSGK